MKSSSNEFIQILAQVEQLDRPSTHCGYAILFFWPGSQNLCQTSIGSFIIALLPSVICSILFQNNYAQKEATKVSAVKAVFEELNLKQVYLDYEERSYNELTELINKLSGQLPKEMFFAYARKIYKRQK